MGSISQYLGSHGEMQGTLFFLSLILCSAPLLSLNSPAWSPVTYNTTTIPAVSTSSHVCWELEHPQDFYGLVHMSEMCSPPRTVSFFSTDQILLKTNSMLLSLDAFWNFPHQMVPACFFLCPLGPVLSQYWTLSLVLPSTSVHVSGPC